MNDYEAVYPSFLPFTIKLGAKVTPDRPKRIRAEPQHTSPTNHQIILPLNLKQCNMFYIVVSFEL